MKVVGRYVLSNEKEVGCENDKIYIECYITDEGIEMFKCSIADNRFYTTYHRNLKTAKAYIKSECGRPNGPRFKWKLK